MVAHYFPEADALRRGYALRSQAAGLWVDRLAQPVSRMTRMLSALERRVQKMRGALERRRPGG
jgi:hypothetical protein